MRLSSLKPSNWKNGIWKRLNRFAEPFLSDSLYLKSEFRRCLGYSLNLDNPRSFNEKLQWLKLESKKHPEYTQMVDKATAKDYVAQIIGDEYIIPTLGVWDSVDDIDWNSLPNQFVVKSTGDSGGIVVCKDKSKLDVKAARSKLKDLGGRDYAKVTKEYPYKNVPHRYIAEEYREDESGDELKDYKFFCFNGDAKFFKIDFNRAVEHHANYYDVRGKLQEFGECVCPPILDHMFVMPINLNKMVVIANVLAQNIKSPFVRIDLYNVKGKIYFGEITFFPASGTGPFTHKEWDFKLGDMIKLP